MWRYIALLTRLALACSEYRYNTKWFTVPLDHFGFATNTTFKIKYLECDDYWDMGGGPIFFYTGNEGPIESFAKYTGFMWDIAAEFKAKLVFAEHRYYGESLPFGNKSLDNQHIGYLTSAQALADYADLVNHLQRDAVNPKYPVIAFGGSYGGILAAYFRIKYPHLVAGAIAASAPVHMYPGMVPCELFNEIATDSYKIANSKCPNNIRRSWSFIRSYVASANTSQWLRQNWNLCGSANSSIDGDLLVQFLKSMYVRTAIVNYPYASDYEMPLPAQPVEAICQYLNESLTDKKLLEAIGKVILVFVNNQKECLNYTEGASYGFVHIIGWSFQACTEIITPMCTTGVTDMFEPSPWSFTDHVELCHKTYDVYPRHDRARIQYGGARLEAASNIVFSNGLRDPWAAGGILNDINDSVKAVVLVDAAHHLDLMARNPADPPSVKMARQFHKDNIRKWINEFNNKSDIDRDAL